MEKYHFQKESHSYQGKITFGEKLTIHTTKKGITKLEIYDNYIQKQFIKRRVQKKYRKLLQMILFYLQTDDDTGVSYHEALDKIEYFRQLIKNKYKAYLNEKQLDEMAKQLSQLKKSAEQKLLLLEAKAFERYKNEIENRRSK